MDGDLKNRPTYTVKAIRTNISSPDRIIMNLWITVLLITLPLVVILEASVGSYTGFVMVTGIVGLAIPSVVLFLVYFTGYVFPESLGTGLYGEVFLSLIFVSAIMAVFVSGFRLCNL